MNAANILHVFDLFDFVVVHIVMHEWGYGLYGGAGNLLTFVSFCDKNTGVRVVCGAGCSPENTVCRLFSIAQNFCQLFSSQ